MSMMFPKTPRKKKKKRHKKSILEQEKGTCYLCVILHDDHRIHTALHEHHIFFGTANRDLSEEYGLKVKLCLAHHETGPEAVHRNAKVRHLLQQIGQKAFEEENPEKDFRKIFGKNYL